MLNFREEQKCLCNRIFVKICNAVCSTIAVTVIPLLILLFIIAFAIKSVDKIQIIYIDRWKLATHRTSTKFLSIGLDSSVIADGFNKFNVTDRKLIDMVRYLYPAYLRVGGNLADRLYFLPDSEVPEENTIKFYKELSCNKYFDVGLAPNYTMTGTQWLKLMKFVTNTDLDIFFDLNALIRFPNGSWDYTNAESLINFSNEHRFNVNWELGNEPNSFRHKFNEEVNATQLAFDFDTLRRILKKYSRNNRSLLVGPDTTRPLEDKNESAIYLQGFLRNAIHAVDAVTWHQYYINGRTADSNDFLNPEVFDLLETQIQTVQNITKQFDAFDKPIWLGETSSAYGGGAPNLSDTFIGSFIWVDKLGLSAKMGIKVVVRQSIFKGYYALLDDNYDPNPDWWISILYKRLVGTRVVPYYSAFSPKVRLYCHCTNNKFDGNPASITVFGVNIGNSAVKVRIEGLFSSVYEKDSYERTLLTTVYAFELTTDSLLSKSVYLNGELLKMSNDNVLPAFKPKVLSSRPFVTMPPFSIVFWVIPSPYARACFF